MSTQAEPKNAAPADADSALAALLFELDGVAVETRRIMFDAVAGVLSKHKVTLTPALFARFAMAGSWAVAAEGLIEETGVSGVGADDLVRALGDRVTHHLGTERASLTTGLDRLLKAAAQRGIPAAAVTALPEDAARAALDRLGLTARGVRLFAFKDDEKAFPRADAWLKVAKSLGKSARFCVAVTSSQLSCKSALSAGMRCIAVPDAYTGHHDYSGADLVLDSWEDLNASEILDCVAPLAG